MEVHVATHEVSFEIPQKLVLANDIVFEIKSNGLKLGSVLISKANIEWVPVNNSVTKHQLTWETFASLMQTQGNVARME
jgi:hypothetical protein